MVIYRTIKGLRHSFAGWDRLATTCYYLAIVCYYLAKGEGTTPILKQH